MADEKQNNGNDLKNAFEGFGKNLAHDAQSKAKSWLWGALSDGLDMLSGNAKKSISSYIFKGEPVPKSGNGRMFQSDRYLDYSSYSNTSTSNTVKRDRDPVGNRASTDLRLIKARTEEEMDTIIQEVYDKIEAADKCRVADLYGFPEVKITPSVSDWSFGWTDRDRGGFSKQVISQGQYTGWYMMIAPKPHSLNV